MRCRAQRGTTTVEFAIVGLVAITILLALIEFSRLVFVLGALHEASRRGVRMAAVCPINDPAIAQSAIFNAPGDGAPSSTVRGLTTANVVVEYLSAAGVVVASPAANFGQIAYVRVRIAGLQHRLMVPLLDVPFTLPAYPMTLPRENLGIPRVGTGPIPC